MGNVTKEYLIKQLHRFEELVLDRKFATPYTAGTGIDITNGVISTDLGTAAGKNFTTYVAPGVTDIPIGASVYAAITSAARGVIRPAGSKTCAQLTSDLLVQANVGNVYKVTDSGVTTELFVGGAGHTIHENDDVIVVYGGSEGVFKFDLQNGVVDMTDYQKKELDQPITVGGTEETTVEGTLESLNTNKVEKVTGKGLSTNDYDNTEKQKVANSVQKSSTAGLLKNDGTVDSTAYAKQSEMSVTNGTGADADKTTIQLKTGTSATVLKTHQDITGKADKVSNATAGDIVSLDANGNLVDSGKAADSIITQTKSVSSGADCNNLTDKYTQYAVGEGVANRPTTGTEGYILVNIRSSNTTNSSSQIAYRIGGTSIYRRNFNGSTWSSWEKLIEESEFKSYGIKTIWTGSKTKGDTGMNFDASPYDLCFAQVGGTWCRLITGNYSGSTGRKKFSALYAGRDYVDAGTYEQYYLLDIVPDGTIATCGWFDIAAKDTQNSRLAAQKALDLAIAGTSTWSDPTWRKLSDVETSVNVSMIIGIKFQAKA